MVEIVRKYGGKVTFGLRRTKKKSIIEMSISITILGEKVAKIKSKGVKIHFDCLKFYAQLSYSIFNFET